MEYLRVCVIGAGASGLACARVLTSEDYRLKVVVFEKTSTIGGQWNYDPDGQSATSAVYRDLRTNIACDIMQYSDFPFMAGESNVYVDQKQVQDYLISYTEYFQLKNYIRFNSEIVSIDETFTVTYTEPIDKPNEYSDKTNRVLIDKTHEKCIYTEQFDAVCVANGHYSEIYIPEDIEGFETRTFSISHSRSYRVPEIYRDKCVVVVGASHSGIDICGELAAVAKKVILSMKETSQESFDYVINLLRLSGKPLCLDYTSTVFSIMPEIEKIENDRVIFRNQVSLQPDHILFATGYQYHTPFLKGKLEFDSKRLRENHYLYPLFKQMFHANVETGRLALLTIPYRSVPFPLAELQSHVFARVLTGLIRLPNREQMIEELDHPSLPRDRTYHLVNMIEYAKDLLRLMEDSNQRFNYTFSIDDRRRIRKINK